jgi:hypothetical protein
MYIQASKTEIVICKVSPIAPGYITEYPVWILYTDGSYSRQWKEAYQRSPPGKLRKLFLEFTIADFYGILEGSETPY